jgi:hypothetical protein
MADGVRHQPMKQGVAVRGRVSGLERLGVTLDEVVEDGCGRTAGGVYASGAKVIEEVIDEVLAFDGLAQPSAGGMLWLRRKRLSGS